MSEDTGAEIAGRLSLGRAEPDAREALSSAYLDGLKDMLAEVDSRLSERVNSATAELTDYSALAEAWLMIHTLTMFTRGVAAGRGRQDVSVQDVHDALVLMCTRAFPHGVFAAAEQAFEAVGLVRALIEGEEGLRELADRDRLNPGAGSQSEADNEELVDV
jgi:hypothetical protein